jgi:hypothetical protein
MSWSWLLLGVLLASPAAAADGPEQLDQLEPGAGEWQAEYFAGIGRDGDGGHAIEAMLGLSDRVALGFEIETELADGRLAFETFGPKLLYRLTDREAPVAMGLQLQLGFDEHARLAEAEARVIVEAESDSWWAQGNFMARRRSDGRDAASSLAYAGSLQHAVGEFAWFGIEASGQSAPLSGEAAAADERGHFAGPSLTLEWKHAADRELEVGIAYLHRLGGEGAGGSARLFVQFTF